jgi:hypothetical protein
LNLRKTGLIPTLPQEGLRSGLDAIMVFKTMPGKREARKITVSSLDAAVLDKASIDDKN